MNTEEIQEKLKEIKKLNSFIDIIDIFEYISLTIDNTDLIFTIDEPIVDKIRRCLQQELKRQLAAVNNESVKLERSKDESEYIN